MRNEVPDADASGSVVARRARRRRQALAGVVGLAVLGGGSFLVTLQVTDGGNTETRDAAALAPRTPMVVPGSVVAADSPVASREHSASSSKSAVASKSAEASEASKSAVPPASSDERAVAEEIAAARAAAAKDGVKLKRPLRQQGGAAAAAVAAAAKVVNTGSLREDRATLRVVSARGDLTGQRELAMVAGKGKPVGDAFCSQMIRVSAGAKAEKKPNLLLCWRTSARKSVFTVAVDLDGAPSEEKSVAAIGKEWQALG